MITDNRGDFVQGDFILPFYGGDFVRRNYVQGDYVLDLFSLSNHM